VTRAHWGLGNNHLPSSEWEQKGGEGGKKKDLRCCVPAKRKKAREPHKLKPMLFSVGQRRGDLAGNTVGSQRIIGGPGE